MGYIITEPRVLACTSNFYTKHFILYFLSLWGMIACTSDPNRKEVDSSTVQLFRVLPASETNFDFENKLVENNRINILNYLYYYNGSGVAIGDINQDGLPDIYMGSTTKKNKLFLNKGNLLFEDITLNAGVEGDFGITTGVSFVDINQDGYLDIYVCKSGDQSERFRTNELFINNGNLSFSEKAAEYGLADASFSSQAYFFDMDKDNDLDMYLVNHPVDWPNINKIMTGKQNEEGFHYQFSDKLYQNNGQGKYEDITLSAGILNRSWGLSAAIGDFNGDHYPDIYVANDFIKPDNLYINQKDGTFKDEAQQYFRHISFYSMGTDYADINNDGQNDLYVADMAMNGHVRSKRSMGSMSTENFQTIISRGYHLPYSSNTLQYKVGKKSFVDIAQAAGVAKTDWSWAPLLMDCDNDGYKDIFLTNGIYRDIIDNDFLVKKAKYDKGERKNYFDDLVGEIPQSKVKNFFFRNKGNLTFDKLSEKWGIREAINSNGAAYADLDMDGDLDLVTNNLNEPSHIIENLANSLLGNQYLKVKLEGPPKNRDGIGTQLWVHYEGKVQRIDMQPTRGYLSSVDYILHVGLGQAKSIDSIKTIWPDGKAEVITRVAINETLVVSHKHARSPFPESQNSPSVFSDKTADFGINYTHKEKLYNDFKNELLLPHKLSQNGPFLSVADVDGDGLEDFFIGGSAGNSAQLFIQQEGGFTLKESPTFAKDKKYEDQKSIFFDADQDQDMDLYVVSGSNEFSDLSMYQDRLYLNDGKGNFSSTKSSLPKIVASGMAVAARDFDRDGDMDLIVGGRLVPGKYPTVPQSYFLENQKGKFRDVTQKIAPVLKELGMITDLRFTDYDEDGDLDIMAVGEWMPISFLENENGVYEKLIKIPHTRGWWFHIAEGDIDRDGDQDYVVGNIGTNNKYHPTSKKPLHIYYKDFDQNGIGDIALSKKDNNILFPIRGRECSSQQIPSLKDKFPDFASFAAAPMSEIYGQENLENALHFEVNEFKNMLLMNLGKGDFDKVPLAPSAQISPMMGTELLDINEDGYVDILTAGNFFQTETETIRYDAGSGMALLGNEEGDFSALPSSDSGLILAEDVKDLKLIKLKGNKTGILVGSNQGSLRLLIKN